MINNIFTSIIITLIVFIITTSLEMKPDGAQQFLSVSPLSLSSLPSCPQTSPLLPMSPCSPQPVEADGRPHWVWFWRFLPVNEGFDQSAAHCWNCWVSLYLNFKVLTFYVKCLEMMYIMILCYSNQIELKMFWNYHWGHGAPKQTLSLILKSTLEIDEIVRGV